MSVWICNDKAMQLYQLLFSGFLLLLYNSALCKNGKNTSLTFQISALGEHTVAIRYYHRYGKRSDRQRDFCWNFRRGWGKERFCNDIFGDQSLEQGITIDATLDPCQFSLDITFKLM
jgi:hypothetical protein